MSLGAPPLPTQASTAASDIRLARVTDVDEVNQMVHMVDQAGTPMVMRMDLRFAKSRGPEVGEQWYIWNQFGTWTPFVVYGSTDEDADTSRFRGVTVDPTPPTDGQVYTYDSTSQTWIATDPATLDDSGFVLKNEYTAKGDLIVGSGPDADGTLHVGADAMVPIADSTQPLGIRWGTIGSASIGNDDILGPMIAASVWAAGLSRNGSKNAQVNVDGSTIDINGSNQLEVMASGVTATQIASGAVGTTQIANGAVTAAKIAAGTITTTQISSSAGITGGQIAATTITGSNLVSGTITATQIASGAVGTTQIATGAITNTLIAANAISGPEIQAGVWGAGLARDGSSNAAVQTDGTTIGINGSNKVSVLAGGITGTQIALNTITNALIAAATITGASIANGTITGGSSGNLAAATITGTNIAANTITASLIQANTITAAQMASLSLTSQFIQSSNYVAGTTGFYMDYTGFAEFNDLTVRGIIEGTGPVAVPSSWSYTAAASAANLVANPLTTTSSTGWTATAATLATQATSPSPQVGTGYLKVTATTGSALPVVTSPTGTSGIAVVPGVLYVFTVYVRSAVTPRAWVININWYTSGGGGTTGRPGAPSTVGSPTYYSPTSTNDSTGAWTQITVYASPPPDAAYAAVAIQTQGGWANGEVHYLNSAVFHEQITDGFPGYVLGSVVTPSGGSGTPPVITDPADYIIGAGATPYKIAPQNWGGSYVTGIGYPGGQLGLPVTPNGTYRWSYYLAGPLTGTAVPLVYPTVSFYNSSGTFLSALQTYEGVIPVVGTPILHSFSVIAPTSAAYASFSLQWPDTSSGTIEYLPWGVSSEPTYLGGSAQIDNLAAISDVSASTFHTVYGTSTVQVAPLVALLAIAGPWGSPGTGFPAANTYYKLDATNGVVTFVAPQSGTVWIDLIGQPVAGNSTALQGTTTYWAVGPTGGPLAGTEQQVISEVGQAVQISAEVNLRCVVTGLTPNVSYTYYWWGGYATTGGTPNAIGAISGTLMSMYVWAVLGTPGTTTQSPGEVTIQ